MKFQLCLALSRSENREFAWFPHYGHTLDYWCQQRVARYGNRISVEDMLATYKKELTIRWGCGTSCLNGIIYICGMESQTAESVDSHQYGLWTTVDQVSDLKKAVPADKNMFWQESCWATTPVLAEPLCRPLHKADVPITWQVRCPNTNDAHWIVLGRTLFLIHDKDWWWSQTTFTDWKALQQLFKISPQAPPF